MTTLSAPAISAPTLPARRSLLMRSRKLRTLMIMLRAIRYLCTLGPRQICWLVESLEMKHGHMESRRQQLPVDESGRPLPWYTYPAIQYLSQLDLSDKDAFEFGSGNGSLFWATHVRSLVSVESDRQWHAMIDTRRFANQQVVLEENLGEYPASIARQNRMFDLIIVDGKRRRLCAEMAAKHLAADGMIVLDNSDWYPKTAALLRDAGLIQIDFHGYGPVNNYAWTTSLFLKRDVQIRPRSQRLPEPGIASLPQTGDE